MELSFKALTISAVTVFTIGYVCGWLGHRKFVGAVDRTAARLTGKRIA